jgi:hypothetical protein
MTRFLIALFALSSQAAFAAGILDELTPADQAKVKNGEQVTITKPGDGSAWPQIWVYQRMDSTPEEAMAVFSDFERQTQYVPDLQYSKINKQLDKATFEVGYTIATHFFLHPHESYTMTDHLSSYDNGASFKMDWKLVSAQHIRNIVGNLRFEAMGTGTVVAYYNFVTPPSLANGEGAKAVAGIQRTVTALGSQVQTLRTSDQATLQKEIAALRAAVSP